MAGGFIVLLAIEYFWPLRAQNRNFWHWLRHVLTNVTLALMVFVTAQAILVPTADFSFKLLNNHPSWGLIPWLSTLGIVAPNVLILLGFLLIDLSFYYWHVANHRFPIFWRFHNVHHMDRCLDVSTGFRFHFGEVILSALFRFAQIIVIGMSLKLYLVYEAVFQAATLFHHSNWRLPLWLDRALNLIIVTPRMHSLHHSNQRSHTDSNFSVILSWWDRLHRSFNYKDNMADLTMGVPGYALPADEELGSILMAPFRRQKPYWKQPPPAP